MLVQISYLETDWFYLELSNFIVNLTKYKKLQIYQYLKLQSRWSKNRIISVNCNSKFTYEIIYVYFIFILDIEELQAF